MRLVRVCLYIIMLQLCFLACSHSEHVRKKNIYISFSCFGRFGLISILFVQDKIYYVVSDGWCRDSLGWYFWHCLIAILSITRLLNKQVFYMGLFNATITIPPMQQGYWEVHYFLWIWRPRNQLSMLRCAGVNLWFFSGYLRFKLFITAKRK